MIRVSVMRVALLTPMVLVLAVAVARAQAPAPSPPAPPAPVISDAARAVVGTWEISNADRDRKCVVTFKADPAPGGFKLEPDAACAIGPIKDAAAWMLGQKDVLRLLDGKGVAVLELNEVESGMYEGERHGEGLYFMQSQATAAAATHTPEQLVGDWTFLREIDKPLCTLTLSNAKDGENYKLTVKPRCDAGIANFGLTNWRLEEGELVLRGRAGTWRFGESDATVWERIPLGADPLLLVRQ